LIYGIKNEMFIKQLQPGESND